MADVSPKQLLWNQFRKQNLYLPEKRDFFQIACDQLGLHSTDYWTPYFSVWARIGNYDAAEVFNSINTGRILLRTHAFRTTIHLVHLDNFSLVQNATGPSMYRAVRKNRELKSLSDDKVAEMLRAVRKAFENGPLTKRDLKAALPDYEKYMRSLLHLLFADGSVIRATAKHARSNLTTYSAVKDWVPGFELEQMDETDAIREVVRRHIETFGPVTVDDIAWWLRQTKTAVKQSIEQLADQIIEIDLESSARFMSADDHDIAASIEAPSDSVVWFLPYEDHFLKAFIGRDTYIDSSIQPKISPASPKHYWPSDPNARREMPSPGVRVTGEVRPTIWLNGCVVGRWELDKSSRGMEVVTSLYKKMTTGQRENIEDVRQGLESFINEALLPISGGK